MKFACSDKSLTWCAVVCFLVGLGLAGGLAAQVPVPDDVELMRDVVFGKGGGRELRLHLARSKKQGAAAVPAIVWIHGGGWTGGSRDGGVGNIIQWARRGYVAASIEYRLSGEAKFPAQIEDCKCAIRFLRAKASDYGIDAAHIGVAGHSAGGHLSALLGTSGELSELDGSGGWPEASSQVQAVCTLSGPADFVTWGKSIHPAVRGLLGGTVEELPAKAALASPVTHVKKTTPPFLIIHGDQDDVVPAAQGRAMHAALEQAKGEATLMIIEGAQHFPYGQRTTQAMNDFFDKHLKGLPVQ